MVLPTEIKDDAVVVLNVPLLVRMSGGRATNTTGKKRCHRFVWLLSVWPVFYAGLAISCVQPASPCFDKWMDGSDQASAAAADVTFPLFVSLPLY